MVVNEKGKSIFLKSDGKPNRVLSIRYDSTAEILILALLIIEEDHTTQPTRMPTVSTARASTSQSFIFNWTNLAFKIGTVIIYESYILTSQDNLIRIY